MPWPLVGRADHLLPVETVCEGAALGVVAAGQADEGRVHVGHELHQIRTQAVGRVLISRREQRDEAEADAAGAFGREDEPRLGGGRGIVAGRELDRVLLPGRADGGTIRLGDCDVLPSSSTSDAVTGPAEAASTFGVEAGGVGGVRPDGDAPVAVVGDTRLRCRQGPAGRLTGSAALTGSLRSMLALPSPITDQ